MKPHEEWLLKAQHDIESSEVLFKEKNDLNDIAIYHTQQCAEKSLKAFLAFNEKELDKLHNLTVLLNSCSQIDNSFEELKDDAIFLNPYATLYRYPDGDFMPSSEETSAAIKKARDIFKFVKNKVMKGKLSL